MDPVLGCGRWRSGHGELRRCDLVRAPVSGRFLDYSSDRPGRPAEAGLARPPGPTRLASNRGLKSGTAFAALRSEPWRPTGGNPERICDTRRPWTWHPTLVSAGAQPVSQPPTPGRQSPGWWFQHHAHCGPLERACLHRLTTLAFCAHGSMSGHAIETIRTATISTRATASAKTYG